MVSAPGYKAAEAWRGMPLGTRPPRFLNCTTSRRGQPSERREASKPLDGTPTTADRRDAGQAL
jgi:hypothetical protein